MDSLCRNKIPVYISVYIFYYCEKSYDIMKQLVHFLLVFTTSITIHIHLKQQRKGRPMKEEQQMLKKNVKWLQAKNKNFNLFHFIVLFTPNHRGF